MIQKMSSVILISICAYFCFFVPAFAQTPDSIFVKVGEARGKKSRVAFPSLQFAGSPGAQPKNQSLGAELYQVILNDLSVAGFFEFISPSGFLENPNTTTLFPAPGDPQGFRYAAWKQIGADFLIRGAFSLNGDALDLDIYVYNVNKSDLVIGKKYKESIKALRRIGHTFANEFLKELTGENGPFLSRVVVASDRGGANFREIYVMDWDGTNVEKITNHRSVALSPAWSPKADKVAYTAFVQRTRTKTRNADLFVYELLTGKRWLVSYREGMNSGANFLKNGEELFVTLSKDGNPDIYRLGLDGTMKSRVTSGPRGAMNVEPAVSPDGKQIAFSSDRSGQPMIYIMNLDGSNVKRITFAGKYNATPAWSPKGDLLAFSGWTDNNFDIFTIRPDGTQLTRLTSASKPNGRRANNEDPTFSPDGRLIMFTSNRTGANQIYVITADGQEERRITTDKHNYFKPKWSINLE
jgi:TolB protein